MGRKCTSAMLLTVALTAPADVLACAFHGDGPLTGADRFNHWLNSFDQTTQRRIPVQTAFRLDFPESTTVVPGKVEELVVGYAWRMLARDVRIKAVASSTLALAQEEFPVSSASGEVRIPYTLIDPKAGFIDLAISGIVNGREVTQRARVQVRPPKNELAISQR